jgi:hypothetical protein
MVAMDMLIVKPSNPQDTGRISCFQLHARLAKMLKKCSNVDYVCSPAGWPYSEPRIEEVVRVDVKIPILLALDATGPQTQTLHACAPGVCTVNKNSQSENEERFEMIMVRVLRRFFWSQVFRWFLVPVMICGVLNISGFLKNRYVS